MKSVDIKPREILSDVASLFNLVGESFTRLKLKFKVHRMTRAYNWNVRFIHIPERDPRDDNEEYTRPIHLYMVMAVMTMIMTMIILVIMMKMKRTHGSYNCYKLACEWMMSITCFKELIFRCPNNTKIVTQKGVKSVK